MATFAPPLRAPRDVPVIEPARPRRPMWAQIFHGVLLATAFVVCAWPIALVPGLWTGAAGAIAGAMVAEALVRRRFRLGVIALGAVSFLLLGQGVLWLILASEALAMALSPELTIGVAEAVRWAIATFGASILLRATAIRFRAALAVEGSLAVLAVGTTVAAHRDGMIARPLNVSDWFWTQGIDPVVAFLLVGLVGAVLFSAVLAYGRSPGRTVAQLVLVLILGVFLAASIHSADPETPQKNAVGAPLDKQTEDGRRTQGGGGKGQAPPGEEGGGGTGSKDDMPGNGKGPSRPAAVVVFHKDVTPAQGVFYFRHGAFSQFNGTRLVESTLAGIEDEARQSFPSAVKNVAGPPEGAMGRTEVATDVALLTEHKRPFALADAIQLAPMPNPEPARFRRAYRVVSSVLVATLGDLVGSEPGDAEWSDEVWEHYTAVPKDPRYHELAVQLQQSLRVDYQDDPVARALMVKDWLEKNVTYSFVRKHEGEDPTSEFLFSEDKRGYCVHIAHAAAFLLRAMGVPARVSAGYAVSVKNLGGGSALLVKTGDQHAWAEIYLEGVGWVPVEVTPEKSDVKPDAFEERDLQQLLGEMARKEGRHERAAFSGKRLIDTLRAIAKGIPWVMLAILLAAYAVKLWRLSAPSLWPERKAARVAYRAALDRLSAAGFVRGRGEPRERFARRVAQVAPAFVPLTGVVVGSVLGARDPVGAAAGERLARLSGRVGHEVRRAIPRWRWLIGALNPISYLWSR